MKSSVLSCVMVLCFFTPLQAEDQRGFINKEIDSSGVLDKTELLKFEVSKFEASKDIMLSRRAMQPSADEPTAPQPSADLSLSLSGKINGSSKSFFYLSVNNLGNTTADNVQVSMPLNCSENGLSVPIPAVADYYDCNTGILTLGSIGSGQTVSKEIPFLILSSFSGPLELTAQILSSSLPDPDSQMGNNNASEDDQASLEFDRAGITYPTVGEPVLTITTSPAYISQDAATLLEGFSITVTNVRDLAATDVSVNLNKIGDAWGRLPVYIPTGSNGGTTQSNWPTDHIWNIGDLAPGESQTITADLIINIYGSQDFKIFLDGVLDNKSTNNVQLLPVTGLCNTENASLCE